MLSAVLFTNVRSFFTLIINATILLFFLNSYIAEL